MTHARLKEPFLVTITQQAAQGESASCGRNTHV